MHLLACSRAGCRNLGLVEMEKRDGAGRSVRARLCAAHLGRLPDCLGAMADLRRADEAAEQAERRKAHEGRRRRV